jgi:hypothetical protein
MINTTRLRRLYRLKLRVEKAWNEELKKLPCKNKTHAWRQALGLCPTCGAEKGEGYYCAKHAAMQREVQKGYYERKTTPQIVAQPESCNAVYNNDNH